MKWQAEDGIEDHRGPKERNQKKAKDSMLGPKMGEKGKADISEAGA